MHVYFFVYSREFHDVIKRFRQVHAVERAPRITSKVAYQVYYYRINLIQF